MNKLKALIVDDDAVNARFLEEALTPYAVCQRAEHGMEGVRAFEATLALNEPFDLIFMDIMMPGMDGHQALETIRDIERKRSIPDDQSVKVIMISAFDDMKHVSRAFFQGHALAFLNKPFDVQTLLDELRKFHFID
jgi:two-component system, chemotaxis family, chemotaxis protein CheY